MTDRWRFFIWGMLLGCAIMFAGAQLTLGLKYNAFTAQKLVEAENIDLVKKILIGGDDVAPDFWQTAIADDIKFNMIGSTPLSGERTGKQAVFAYGAELAALIDGSIDLTIDNIRAAGEWVFIQSHGEARTKTGAPYSNIYAQVYRVRDGKVIEIHEYMDTQKVMDAFYSEPAAP